MHRTRLVLLAAALAVLGALSPAVVPAASAAPADTIYALVNQARAQAGLRGFLRNPSMDAVAAAWAEQLAAQGELAHNPHFTTQIPAGWTGAGENVASGYPSPQAMFTAWMKSPGHRANILGAYTDIGISFISANGVTWGVQDFGAYRGHVGPAAPAPAPKPSVASSSPPSATPSAAPSASASASPLGTDPALAARDRTVASSLVSAVGFPWVAAVWVAVCAALVAAAIAAMVLLGRRRGRHRATRRSSRTLPH